ncbi:U3-containing 90S pre-ribosomal complex subunit-domain containing protein [Zopfochytrium polystomum]|nr:U3-containing 90S pre-ribosomal complex subunit-domain containing protein [Zopfochytrium polystomum]
MKKQQQQQQQRRRPPPPVQPHARSGSSSRNGKKAVAAAAPNNTMTVTTKKRTAATATATDKKAAAGGGKPPAPTPTALPSSSPSNATTAPPPTSTTTPPSASASASAPPPPPPPRQSGDDLFDDYEQFVPVLARPRKRRFHSAFAAKNLEGRVDDGSSDGDGDGSSRKKSKKNKKPGFEKDTDARKVAVFRDARVLPADDASLPAGRSVEDLVEFIRTGYFSATLAPRGTTVVVAALSADRAVELIHALKQSVGRVCKLFARHIKAAEQRAQLLSDLHFDVAVGTPQRLLQLVDDGAFANKNVMGCLLLDAQHRDLKSRSLFDCQELRDALVGLVRGADAAGAKVICF